MKRFLKEYFSFSYSEMRVVLILSFLVLTTLVLRLKVEKMELTPESVPEVMITEVEEFIASMEEKVFSEKNGYEYSELKESFPLFIFDPNTTNGIKLKKLGFDERTVRNILKYREAGGRFQKPEDLKKIYGMNESIFMMVKDYIKIDSSIFILYSADRQQHELSQVERPDTFVITNRKHSWNDSKSALYLDINSASPSELLALNGIGKVFSERIVRYRDLLGGFYTIDQLSEVYGITDSMVNLWKGSLYADTGRVNYISVNYSPYKQLLRHPYLDKKQVDGIVRYRSYSKTAFIPSDLLINGVISDSCFNRIKAYLIP